MEIGPWVREGIEMAILVIILSILEELYIRNESDSFSY